MARVVLVGPEIEENLSLRYLAAALARAGHDPDIAAFDHWSEIPAVAARIADGAPDVVGLSMAFQARAEETMTLAGRLRRMGFRGHVTAGGHFATFEHERILNACPSIDSVVRGEGETGIVAIASGRWRDAPGISHRDAETGRVTVSAARPAERPPVVVGGDWPDRRGPRRTHLFLPTAPVVASQGCWGRCSFCCIQAFRRAMGRRGISMRPVEDLAAEMAFLWREHGVRVFIFQDDNLFLASDRRNVERIRSLREALVREGVDPETISTVVKSRPETVTPDLLDALAGIGLVRVFLGVENMSRAGLDALYRGLTPERNLEALELIDGRGTTPCYNVLIFHPWARLDEIGENIANLRRAPRHVPFNPCRTEVYAGTPIAERLAREGRLTGGFTRPGYEIEDPRVEVMFRMFEAAFAHRSFHFHGAVNEAMALAYDAGIAGRHWGRVEGVARLVARSRDVIADVNETTLALLDEMHALVARAPLAKEDVEEHALALSLKVARLEQRELEHVVGLRREIEERVRAHLAGERDRRWRSIVGRIAGWTAVPAVTLALGAGACKLPGDDGGGADREETQEGGGGNEGEQVEGNTDGMEGEIIPWIGRYHGESVFYSGTHLLVTHKAGTVPENVEIAISKTASVDVTSLASPDRSRVMLSIQPALAPAKDIPASVTVELLKGEEVIERWHQDFWVYTTRKLTIGPEHIDPSEDVRVMDPVPISQSGIDLTVEKNVDILLFESHIHGSWMREFDVSDGKLTWKFDSIDGHGVATRGLDLYAEPNRDGVMQVLGLEITATGGTIRHEPDTHTNMQFHWDPPTTEDGTRLEAGTFHIDAVYTVETKKGEAELAGRATVVVEPDGDILLMDVTVPDPSASGTTIGHVKSLPRTLRLGLAVTGHAPDVVALTPRLEGRLSTAEPPMDAIEWEVSDGHLAFVDGTATWHLTGEPGTHRLTCWVRDPSGALTVASHFEHVT